MNAIDILRFRQKLDEDVENKEFRRTLHENYEWLDGYWRQKWERDGNNAIIRFCNAFGEFYWQNVSIIPELANELGMLGPIGSSKNSDYSPAPRIAEATKLLKSGEGSPTERFTAMMELVRQIRNNLFHGQKMDLEDAVYERNKELVRLGAKITTVILDHLMQISSLHSE